MAKKYVKSGVIQAYSKDEALDMLEELCDDGFIRNFYFNYTWRTLDELPKKDRWHHRYVCAYCIR